jgi:hypothetical protein
MVAYPRHLANRIDGTQSYDLVFVSDPDGAVAVRSSDRVHRSTLNAMAKAGFDARLGPRGIAADQLPRVAPRLLWVNPTAADLLRLRWITVQGPAPRVQAKAHRSTGSTDIASGESREPGRLPRTSGLIAA